jgi:hypothetical protein
MKKLIATCLMMFAMTVLPACKSVVSDHLIGERLESEQAQAYEGVWRTNNAVVHIKNVGDGELIVAGLEWKDGAFKLNELRVVVTRHQDANFVQMIADDDEEGNGADDTADADASEDTEPGDEPWLVLGLLSSPNEDTLVLNSPRFDRFKQAVQADQLEGQIEGDGNTVWIRGDKAALDGFVQPDRLHELFQLDDPGVLIRVGDLE